MTIREVEVNYWYASYDRQELCQTRERKRKEIFDLLDRCKQGSRRSTLRARHLSDDINNIILAIDGEDNK